MKYLFTNGDSWTWGQGLQEDQVFPPFPHKRKPRGQWPEVLGEKLNIEVINIAENGSSNERILRSTIEWVVDNKDKINETLFIIGWTISDRWEWWSNFKQDWEKCYASYCLDYEHGDIEYGLPNKWWNNFHREYFDINKMLYKTTLDMVYLQSFFKFYNLNYLFFDTFGHHFREDEDLNYENEGKISTPCKDHPKLYKELDFDNIVMTEDYKSMEQFMKFIFDDFEDAKEHIHGHPNRKSHEMWSEELYKFLKKEKL